MDEEAWRDELVSERREKDHFMAESPHSPIPAGKRDGFDGLAYYEPDPAYRITVPLERDERETVEVHTSTGEARTYDRLGTFTLPLPGGTIRLAAYDSEHHDGDELFVPFQDATSGEETYGAGRYLEAIRVDGNRYLVDLNRAYHPFCAYNDAYACPLPPPENRVDVPVRAGERNPT